MRKSIALIIAGAMTLSLAACGSSADPVTAESTSEVVANGNNAQPGDNTEVVVGLPNPVSELDESEIPTDIVAPEGATNIKWSKIDVGDSPVIQLTFDYADQTFTAREQVTGDLFSDISGMYYTWTATEDVRLSNWAGGEMPATIYSYVGDDESAQLVTWYDIETGVSYSLSTTGADLDGLDIQVVADAIKAADFYDESMGADDVHQPLNITECETFTQIVDRMPVGWAYANVTFGDTDALLVTDYTFNDPEMNKDEAILADVYIYMDGVPTYRTTITSGGTAYPITSRNGKLYVGANHFVKAYDYENGEILENEAGVNYDENGNASYYVCENGGEQESVGSDMEMNALYGEMFKGEIVSFNVIQ